MITTLREHFASDALRGFISNPSVDVSYEHAAEMAVKQADALLKQLGKPVNPQREEELVDLLSHALVYVEDQLDDPTNKPGVVRALATKMRKAIGP